MWLANLHILFQKSLIKKQKGKYIIKNKIENEFLNSFLILFFLITKFFFNIWLFCWFSTTLILTCIFLQVARHSFYYKLNQSPKKSTKFFSKIRYVYHQKWGTYWIFSIQVCFWFFIQSQFFHLFCSIHNH